jgi:hypothetical protein
MSVDIRNSKQHQTRTTPDSKTTREMMQQSITNATYEHRS